MSANYAEEFKRLFEEECTSWDGRDQQRFLNIPNSQEEVDEDEIEACREFIDEVNSRNSQAG